MYLCLCKALTERDVDRSIQAGNVTAEALVAALGLDDPDACGRCARDIDTQVPVLPLNRPSGWPAPRPVEMRARQDRTLPCVPADCDQRVAERGAGAPLHGE